MRQPRRQISAVRRLARLALLGLALGGAASLSPRAAQAEGPSVDLIAQGDQVIQRHEDGQINWTEGVVEVIGVGTPKILSPTGGLTERDPYTAAREDAQRRLTRILADVQIDRGRALAAAPDLAPLAEVKLRGFTSEAARHFSDGTVHLPARLPLGWIPEALAAAEMGVPMDAVGGSGGAAPAGAVPLVIQLSASIAPAVQIELVAPGEGDRPRRQAGLPGDLLAVDGVRWVKGKKALAALRRQTPAPVIIEGAPGDGPGVITLTAEGQAVAFRPMSEGGRPGARQVWVVTP